MFPRRNALILSLGIFLITTFALTAHASPSQQQPPDDQWTIIRNNGQIFAFNGTLERQIHPIDRSDPPDPMGWFLTSECVWSPKQDWVQVRIVGRQHTVTVTRLSDGYSLSFLDLLAPWRGGNYPAWSPDGEWLVYEDHSPNRKDNDLYRMDSDGTEPQMLYSSAGSEYILQFDSTGEWVYFYTDDPEKDTVYRIHPDGTDLTEILHVNGELHRVALSPDEEWIFYTVNDGTGNLTDPHTYHLTDGQDYVLDDSPQGTGFQGFSPDSQWVFYTLGYPNSGSESLKLLELYAARVDNSQRQLLFEWPAYNSLSFSRNSQYAFFADSESREYYRWHIGSNESPTLVATTDPERGMYFQRNAHGIWGSNGNAITFAPQDGSEPRTFLTGSTESQQSPDNKWYTAISEGKLYRIRTDGTEFDPLAISPLTDSSITQEVFWSPDGQWIAMMGDGGLYATPVDGAQLDLLLAGSPSMLWVWSLDSQQIFAQTDEALYAIPLDGTAPEVLAEGAGSPLWLSPDRRWIMRNDGAQVINLTSRKIWNVPDIALTVMEDAFQLAQTENGYTVNPPDWSETREAAWSEDSQIFNVHFQLAEPYQSSDGPEDWTGSGGTIAEFYYQIFPAEQRVSDLIAGSPPYDASQPEIVECVRP